MIMNFFLKYSTYFILLLLSIGVTSVSFAQTSVDSLKNLLYNSQDYEVKIKSALEISKYYERQTPDSSLTWARFAYQLAVQEKDVQWQIKALIPLCEYEFLTDLWHQSVETALIADSFLTIYPNDTLRLPLLYRLAEGYEYTTRLQLGMNTYEACYQLAEKLDNRVMLGRLDLKMGHLNLVLGEKEEALNFLKKAIKNLDTGDPAAFEYYHGAYISYADLILKNTSIVSVEEINNICQSLLPIYNKIPADKDFLYGKESYLDLQVKCLLLNGSTEQIQVFSLPSIAALTEQTPYENRLRDRLDVYGLLALRQGKLNEAKAYIDRGWEIADKSANIVMKIYSLEMKKALFKEKESYKEMVETMEAILPYEEELHIHAKMTSLNKLENQLAAKEKQHEIDLLSKDKELLLIQNRYYIISLLGFSVFSLIIGWLFHQTRQKNKLIAHQNQELTTLNLTKDRLFSIIGHDLRKPALAFRGISKKVNFLIQQQEYDTLNKLGGNLEQAAFSLNSLLDNLLNWALKQRDVLPYDPKPVNIQHATEEIFQLFGQITNEKDIQLELSIAEAIHVFSDPNAITTIIRNLVDNAIKFTPSGGKIKVSSRQVENNVLIEIKDTGTGMTAEQLTNVFELHKNKSTRGTAGEKGSGLGLRLVKDLVDLNKGEIQVYSKIKEGTTFKVLLPAA